MKKRSLKTKLLALSVVLILAALSVYGTLAYFTSQGTARNACHRRRYQDRPGGADAHSGR